MDNKQFKESHDGKLGAVYFKSEPLPTGFYSKDGVLIGSDGTRYPKMTDQQFNEVTGFAIGRALWHTLQLFQDDLDNQQWKATFSKLLKFLSQPDEVADRQAFISELVDVLTDVACAKKQALKAPSVSMPAEIEGKTVEEKAILASLTKAMDVNIKDMMGAIDNTNTQLLLMALVSCRLTSRSELLIDLLLSGRGNYSAAQAIYGSPSFEPKEDLLNN